MSDHLHARQLDSQRIVGWRLARTEGDPTRVAGWRNPAMLQRYGRRAAEERARDAHKRLGLGDTL